MTSSKLGTTLILAGVLAGATGSWAADNPWGSCQAGRLKAAGKYAECIQSQLAKVYLGSFNGNKLGRCIAKYGATYDKLQLKAQLSPGAETCDAARFVDHGDGTVTDNLTALQWEKKTDDATVHDKDDRYTWSVFGGGSAADGTAFATFLPTLNGAGFAGQYDWRLPTVTELLSIVQPPYPNCIAPPCVDPTFGPTVSSNYWSSSAAHGDPVSPNYAWTVSFMEGLPANPHKTNDFSVRAVRGGF